MKERDKNVVFITEEGIGIARPLYRGKIPTRGLESYGWRSRCCPVLYEQEDGRWNGYLPGETVRGLTPKFIVSHVLLSPRKGSKPNEPIDLQWEPQKEVVEQARSNGQKWFFDLDDNVWELPPWNPAYGKPYGITSHLKEWTADFNSADGLIVSTDSIADSARNNGVEVPIHIVKNCVNTSSIRKRSDHLPLRLGYIGLLDFRQRDFEIVVDDLKKNLEGFRHEIELWHCGAHFEPDKPSIRDILRPFPVDIVERPWSPPEFFQDALRNIDIAILPSYKHPFNDGRSYVVGLELMAAGVPFWASKTREYEQLSMESWCCIYRLPEFLEWMQDEDWRELVRERNQAAVLDHSPKKYAQDLIKVFESVK